MIYQLNSFYYGLLQKSNQRFCYCSPESTTITVTHKTSYYMYTYLLT
jgi:hypothetical protein